MVVLVNKDDCQYTTVDTLSFAFKFEQIWEKVQEISLKTTS